MDWLQSQVKLFRALLYCYPAEFRHEYAAEMEVLFSDRLHSEPPVRLWLETLADLAASAAAEHAHALASDLKYGVRSFKSAPTFAAITLFVIALGIGATVSVFSFVNAVLLRSLPYGNPESLVYLFEPNHNFKGIPEELGPNIPDVYDWQRFNHSFLSIAAFHRSPSNLLSSGSASRVGAASVTADFFKTLQVRPALGRVLDANDDRQGHQHVAVISNAFWRGQFAAANDILGQEISLNRQRYTVVGVMPKDFGYPFDGDVPYESSEFKQTDIWLPAAYTSAQRTDRINFRSANAIARLRPGVSAAAAQTDLMSIEARLQPLYPEMWKGWTALVAPLVQTIVGPSEKMLWLLLGAVGMVLLIAITNVANLLLARTMSRANELGIRTALGAKRSRLIRQLLTESLMLSVAGGALGIALAFAAVRAVASLNPGGIPRFETASVDLRVLLMAVALAIATGVLAGVAPAISALKANVSHLLKDGGTRITGQSSRGRFLLIVTEVGLSVILLNASGLLIRSYLRLAAVDPGFSPATLTFELKLDERYDRTELQTAFYKTFLDNLQAIPGVRYAGASTATPLTDHESVTFAEIRGFGHSSEMLANYSTTPDYRKALATPLLRGRDFNLQDASRKPPVVVVNAKFASLYFKDREPLGGQIRLGIGDLSKQQWSTIVGVVADVRHLSVDEAAKPQIFQPIDHGEDFALACDAPVPQVIAEARHILHSLDPGLTLQSINTMGERISQSNARRIFQTTVLTCFAAIAVALALSCIYGLMSYSIKQRTGEIGLRIALGSSRASIVRLILAKGLQLTGVGLLIGLAASFGLTRLIGVWLYQVSATDPLTMIVVPLFVLAVSSCACILPAWNAARVDPIQALR